MAPLPPKPAAMGGALQRIFGRGVPYFQVTAKISMADKESKSEAQVTKSTLRDRLQAEAKAPYRGLRRVFYGVFAASGLMGAFILGLKGLAGTAAEDLGWNLALQVGVVALMIALWRWDRS